MCGPALSLAERGPAALNDIYLQRLRPMRLYCVCQCQRQPHCTLAHRGWNTPEEQWDL